MNIRILKGNDFNGKTDKKIFGYTYIRSRNRNNTAFAQMAANIDASKLFAKPAKQS